MFNHLGAKAGVVAILASLAGTAVGDVTPLYVDVGVEGMGKSLRAVARASNNVKDESGFEPGSGPFAMTYPLNAFAEFYDPPVTNQQLVQIIADTNKVGGLGMASIRSSIDYSADGVGSHSYYVYGWNHETFPVSIEASDMYPAGTPLTLEFVGSSTVTGSQWAVTDWSLTIGILVVDAAHPTGTLNVTAGQVISASWSQLGQTVEAAQANTAGWYFSASVDMSLAPEPATLSLLALGALAIMRRRGRS